MQIAPIVTSTPSTPSYRAPSASADLALVDMPGAGFFVLRDTLTGYGRQVGYDSLANARRAAYMLSVGADSPAAGVFQQGDRFFVRALGTVAAHSPHVDAGDAGSAVPAPEAPASHALQLLHFEGNAKAHFAWVANSHLVLIVDGATKVWSRDAHHPAPKG